ncbi:hypothetical protein YC2023_065104 [Brassica napus]
MNSNSKSTVSGDFTTKKPNGKDVVSSASRSNETGKPKPSSLLLNMFPVILRRDDEILLCSFNITDGWVKGSLQNLKFLGMLVIRIAVGICRDLRKKSLLPFDVLLTTYDIALVDQDFLSQVPW